MSDAPSSLLAELRTRTRELRESRRCLERLTAGNADAARLVQEVAELQLGGRPPPRRGTTLAQRDASIQLLQAEREQLVRVFNERILAQAATAPCQCRSLLTVDADADAEGFRSMVLLSSGAASQL